jgi:hypothetical protein
MRLLQFGPIPDRLPHLQPVALHARFWFLDCACCLC